MANSVVKLTIDSQEYDAKLKSAGKALNDYFDICKKGDRTFTQLDEGVMEAVQAMGKMETASKSAKGSLSELQRAFTDMSLTYRRFTDEEKASPVGKAMAQSLAELKTRIQDTKKDLAAINQELSGSKFGQFGGVIDTIGHKMGLTANATELLTSKTALMYAGIGAGIAIVGKASDAWSKYNQELAKQDQITTVTTGLKGTESNHMTDTMRALSDTYKVDFREAINAANTLMSQFGVNGDEAIQLIKDGMQGMIQGDGPKLLQMIKQYAPAFRDAGVSASQLVAVIHNSEGGIFTDQNMNAIVMGMKNIRLMTKQTSDALAQLGIDGKKMSQDLNAGTITVFDALKQVAGELKNVDSNSQAAGQVMQAVFGRQGVTAGTNIAKAIETLNTNLEETKKQTGDLGDAFADLQTANEHLNTAIREAFSYDGWEQMATGIKSTLIDTLADVIDQLGTIKGLLAGLTPGQAKSERYGTTGTPDEVKRDLEALSKADADTREAMYQGMLQKYEKRFQDVTNQMRTEQNKYDAGNRGNFVQRYNPLGLIGQWWQSTNVNTARSNVAAEQDVLSTFRKEAAKILNPQQTPPPNNNNNNNNNGSGTKLTDQQKAQAKFDQAEKDYKQALEQITLELNAKSIDTVEAKKKELAAEEALWKAIGNAREVHDDPKLKESQDEAAKRYTELGGSVNALVEEQKKAQEAAREMAAAQKRVATALDEAAEAYKANDLKGYISAQKKVGGDPMQGIATGGFTYTESNLNAFIQQLKEQIAQADLGSELYKNLTAQLADANALANLMQTAVKNGIDISQFNPQDLWSKVFGKNPGDYITDAQWQTIQDTINAKLKEMKLDPIKLKFETGGLTNDAEINKDAWKDAASAVQQLGSALNGLEDPSAKVAGTIAQAIATIALSYAKAMEMAATTSGPWGWIAFAATGAATMISTISTVKNASHYAHGGIVPGNDYSDSTPVFVSSGELILNKAQQNNLASALENEESAPQSISTAYLQELCEYASSIDDVSKQIYILINNDVMETLHDIKWASAFGGLGLLFSNGGVVRAANGFSGVVPGTQYSGDNIPALLNAGEVVLNRAQVGNLASQLGRREDNGGGSSIPYVSGEQIFLGLNNYLKRSGRGELLTARG